MHIDNNIRIILASASPRRKDLLEQAGASFEIIPSVGEEIITTKIPDKEVEELSRQKAGEIEARVLGPAIIIGADTVVAIDGEILGKPKDEEDAVRMLSNLQGRTHQVYTGVTVIIRTDSQKEYITFSESTSVTMYPMTDEEIRGYVRTGEPMDKAGAYGIQGLSAVYIQKIDGDYNNVVGLPLARLYQELKKAGFDLTLSGRQF